MPLQKQGKIRIGAMYQACIPSIQHDCETTTRGDVLVDPRELEKMSVKRRRCGTPGCVFVDFHNGPHSNDVCVFPRRFRLPGATLRLQ